MKLQLITFFSFAHIATSALAHSYHFSGESLHPQAKVRLSKIKRALDMYYTDCYSYPANEQGLKSLYLEPDTQPVCTGMWGPEPYILYSGNKNLNEYKQYFVDPWGKPFIYTLKKDGTVELKTLGRDAKPGGKGEGEDIVLGW